MDPQRLRSEAILTVEDLIEALSQPLRKEDHADGWSEEIQAAILGGAESLRQRVLAGDFSYAGVARGLDSWGISEGRLHHIAMSIEGALSKAQPQPRRTLPDSRLVVSEDNFESLPFRLTREDVVGCHWYVGGRPPEAAVRVPRVPEPRYFATIPVNSDDPGDEVCSIFIGSIEAMLERSETWNELGVVWLSLHEPSPRVSAWSNPTEPASEHGIVLLDVQNDLAHGPDDWTFGQEGQKFGGRPTFLQREAVQDEWEKLEKDGFRQLVQFGWPECVEGALTKGTWPFGGGAFSIAYRLTGSGREWRWCWQKG